jgi:hypothetical protein
MLDATEPALVQGIILSDHVVREQGTNKATCVGIFHLYNLPQFPFPVPPFFATVGVTNLQPDVRELDVTCRLEVASSGHVLKSASAHLKLPPEAPPLRKSVVVDLSFPLVNTEQIGYRFLDVNAITATAPPRELPQ